MSLFQALPSLRRQGLSSFCNVQLIHVNMQKTIKLYETPDMKVFDMHAEGVMCQSPYDAVDSAAYGYDEQNDLGEI